MDINQQCLPTYKEGLEYTLLSIPLLSIEITALWIILTLIFSWLLLSPA